MSDEKSKEELAAMLDNLLSGLPPEEQKTLRQVIEKNHARPPRSTLTKVTANDLRSLEGEDLDQSIVAYVWRHLEAAEYGTTALVQLPRGLQVFFLSFIAEMEVMNGGLNQLFYNHSFEMAALIPDALRELGASEAAEMFVAVLLVAQSENKGRTESDTPATWEEFAKSYDETKLTQFDGAFCHLANEFPTLRDKYVRDHEALCLHPASGY